MRAVIDRAYSRFRRFATASIASCEPLNHCVDLFAAGCFRNAEQDRIAEFRIKPGKRKAGRRLLAIEVDHKFVETRSREQDASLCLSLYFRYCVVRLGKV